MRIEEPIVILGTPRSGTSMTAGIFHLCGAWAGDCRPADEWNPKGYFENLALGELRARDALRRSAVAQVLRGQGYRGGPWLSKHTPAYWTCWRDFRPRWVYVRRDPEACVRSRLRGGFYQENGFQARLVVDRDLDLIARLHAKQGGHAVDADAVAGGDLSTIRAAVEGAGLAFDEAAVLAFLEPALWH